MAKPVRKAVAALPVETTPQASPQDTPTPAPTPFPIVGIGASAGGLAAFEAFFSGMPADKDPGMAFVLVQHLAPDHKSILSDLIRRYTPMQVFEVEDGMVIKPNCAYIIPPNCDMAFLNGSLQLLEPVAPRGQRLPIDFFFQSLADDQREHAIGIVLSGTGSDGTLGVRAIKNAGGMVMAQSTASSEFDGMPRNAIATGLVDYQLSPAEMPAQLMKYALHAFGKLVRTGLAATPKNESALKKIFVLLRAQTGHDFSQYKPSTIYRRIERRLAVQQLDHIDGYVKYLQQSPPEVEALFRDLLIGVTNFFRDPEAFKVLEEQVIPKLFADKPAGSTVRVWSAGCSTGEEAYSLAILLIERMEALKKSYTVQVFATDIDSRAIDNARAGLYPASIGADVSPERLARFFTLEPGGQTYRIHKGIRDLLVFSEQDLIKDPPFSRLDLISCRNLLIYLDSNLQRKVIPLFHYAINHTGMLFLGSSEGVGEFDNLFAVLDRKAKIYQRKEDPLGQQRNMLNRFSAPAVLATDASLRSRGAQKTAFAVKLPLRELMEQALLSQIAPASALVNAGGDIVYLHGRTGMYLEPTAGEAGIQNILKMAREGLRPSLSTTLHHAVATQQISVAPNIRVKTNGHYTHVNVSVHPVATAAPGVPDAPLYLVMLEDAPEPAALAVPAAQGTSAATAPDAQARIDALTHELRAKDEYLQSTHEELESSNEELKSSNEEMQSVNEELQSTNEELETSKEELQSVNEELATVNTELQTKVTDLSRANNDMNNLLAGTGIGTVFVDHQLRILRFTPAVADIINLIASDVGRPVAHLAPNLLGYSTLVADIHAVLNTLVPIEREVRTSVGLYYILRIQPYRTLDNVIEGAVISFVDITNMVKTRDALHASEQHFEAMVQAMSDIVYRMSADWSLMRPLDGRALVASNDVQLAGWAWLYQNIPADEHARVRQAIGVAIAQKAFFSLEHRVLRPDGSIGWTASRAVPILDAQGNVREWFGAASDVTARKAAEAALQEKERHLLESQRIAHIGSWSWTLTGPIQWTDEMYRVYGVSPETFIPTFEAMVNLIHPEDRPIMQEWTRACGAGEKPAEFEFRCVWPDGTVRLLSGRGVRMDDAENRPTHIFGTVQDITEVAETRDALRKANDLARLAVVVRDAHDAITVKDLQGRILAWNPGAVRMYGWSEAEALQMNVRDRIPPALREQEVEKLKLLSGAQILEPYNTQRLTKSGAVVDISMIATAMLDEAGHMYAIATTERAGTDGTEKIEGETA